MENAMKYLSFADVMETNGIKYRIVNIKRLKELAEQICHTLEDEIIDNAFAQYVGYAFNFQLLERFPEMRSVIVAAKYNPVNSVSFHYRGKTVNILIPPGYVQFKNKQVNLQKTMLEALTPLGYKCERIIVPVKLLAVRSGLAQYGKNNITYVQDFGSHHFLGSFMTDLPAGDEVWQQVSMLPECDSCELCSANCPTQAIGTDRFLLHGEKCLTYFNRNPGEFPGWLKPDWHNSLVGCIRCQDICPVNQALEEAQISLAGFDEIETGILLETRVFDELPDELKKRFDQFGFPELHNFILRNLQILFH